VSRSHLAYVKPLLSHLTCRRLGSRSDYFDLPDEIHHLATPDHVRVNFDIPNYTGDVIRLSTVRILGAIRKIGLKAKVYQAGSSEMYGKAAEVPQRETAQQTSRR
jgi:GDP-D-mannose dehydratase